MTAAPLHKTHDRPAVPREDIIRTLADVANSTCPTFGGLAFQAQHPDYSLFDAPTFSIDIRHKGLKAGLYKFNIGEDALLEKNTRGIILSPLVIQWEAGGQHKQASMDKDIIGHCLKTIDGFIADNAYGYDAALLTTAYLTKQRAGKKFFADMGWSVIEYDKKETGGIAPALSGPFDRLAARIETLSAAHRTTAAEAEHLCFAYIMFKK